jgi:hypothetical protein
VAERLIIELGVEPGALGIEEAAFDVGQRRLELGIAHAVRLGVDKKFAPTGAEAGFGEMGVFDGSGFEAAFERFERGFVDLVKLCEHARGVRGGFGYGTNHDRIDPANAGPRVDDRKRACRERCAANRRGVLRGGAVKFAQRAFELGGGGAYRGEFPTGVAGRAWARVFCIVGERGGRLAEIAEEASETIGDHRVTAMPVLVKAGGAQSLTVSGIALTEMLYESHAKHRLHAFAGDRGAGDQRIDGGELDLNGFQRGLIIVAVFFRGKETAESGFAAVDFFGAREIITTAVFQDVDGDGERRFVAQHGHDHGRQIREGRGFGHGQSFEKGHEREARERAFNRETGDSETRGSGGANGAFMASHLVYRTNWQGS